MDDVESRRSSRIVGRFWVAVEGVDAEAQPRRGDISATGIFFEIRGDIGGSGTVQWLRIESQDRARSVQVMAHVVRVVSLSDIHGEIKGVALEFMPESDEAAANLCDFVRYTLEGPTSAVKSEKSEEGSAPHIATRVEARASSKTNEESAANVSQLSVNTMLLETDWSVAVGEPVRVEIIARGVRRPVRVEGHTVSVLPALGAGPGGKRRYRIAVRVKEEITGPLKHFSSNELSALSPESIARAKKPAAQGVFGASIESPLEQLLSSLIQPPTEPPERGHLEGLLSRIPFTALCSLLELERLTGELRITRGADRTTLYVKDGRFVDVASSAGRPSRTELLSLVDGRDGSFELVIVPVERPDVLGLSMTQLLLDVAREADESKRGTDLQRGD